MKSSSALFILSTFFYSLTAQTVQQKIAQKSCDCIEKKGQLDAQEMEYQLGFCLLEAANFYGDDVSAEYGMKVEEVFAEKGEKFGEEIGVQMALTCPDVFINLVSSSDRYKETYLDEFYEQSITGKINKVEKDMFVVFTVNNESGRPIRYYWMEYIETSADITGSYQEMVGRKVTIEYNTQELFDPKINDYRSFNVITSLKF